MFNTSRKLLILIVVSVLIGMGIQTSSAFANGAVAASSFGPEVSYEENCVPSDTVECLDPPTTPPVSLIIAFVVFAIAVFAFIYFFGGYRNNSSG